MANRTTETVVSFSSPFELPGLDAIEPAGDYRVDHDEQSLDGATRSGWLRTRSYIHLPAIGVKGLRREMAPIEPRDLEAALQRDRRP